MVCRGCRRQIQLNAGGPTSFASGCRTIMQRGGVSAFYAGFLPNALKNLPNKGAHGCSVLQSCAATHSSRSNAWHAVAQAKPLSEHLGV